MTWMSGVYSHTAEVLFHAGCRLRHDEGLQKSARAAVLLLKNG